MNNMRDRRIIKVLAHYLHPSVARQTGVGTRAQRECEAASSLVMVMVVLAFILMGIATYLSTLSSERQIQEPRILDDRVLMVAEAGLAQGISMLNVVSTSGSCCLTNTTPTIISSTFSQVSGSTLIVTNTGTLFYYPNATSLDFSGSMSQFFQTGTSPMSVAVMVSTTTVSNQTFYNVISTAVTTSPSLPTIARRVQATLWEPNFATYESFINNYGPIYNAQGYYFEGFNEIFLGPYHVNSGIAFWPNIWFLSQVSSGGTAKNTYATTSVYNSAITGNPTAAMSAVSILNYYNSTYNVPPVFQGGLSYGVSNQITLPTDMNLDMKTQALKNNAGLTISSGTITTPGPYTRSVPSYSSTAGANYAVTVSGSLLTVQQVGTTGTLGLTGSANYWGPAVTYNISGTQDATVSGTVVTYSKTGPQNVVLSGTTVHSINNALIVYGNIVSLQGTLSGSLTVAAFETGIASGDGNINITGSLQYATVLSYPTNTGTTFQYGESTANLIQSGTINTSVANTLQAQLSNTANPITDILGIVAEGSVTIPQYDLYAHAVATGTGTPMNVDAIIMATGGSLGALASSGSTGGFAAQNYLNRSTGAVNFLGGMIQNNFGQWAQFTSGNLTNGILENRLWDWRPTSKNSPISPPFFPKTGTLIFYPGSWKVTNLSGLTGTAALFSPP